MAHEKSNSWASRRAVSLTLAVLHHGLSNFAPNTVPSSWHTVLGTARRFRLYLDGQDNPPA